MDSIDISKFKYQYLPDYARFLLNNKLEEFVLVGIRFARELDLPMMRPLSKIPENQLIELSQESNREILEGLASNNIVPLIKKNISNFVNNSIKDLQGNTLIEKTDIVAEDIILAFHIRRKVFGFFLYAYTQNAVVHMLIANDVDSYTTQEHLLTTKAYIGNLKMN
ncbi:MAG: hypothetical protein K0Q95_2638 [Bacteroidota bacterium]|jgi:hypothetical protein|nr:hypothetical protein [Bacteroidota bacterium]